MLKPLGDKTGKRGQHNNYSWKWGAKEKEEDNQPEKGTTEEGHKIKGKIMIKYMYGVCGEVRGYEKEMRGGTEIREKHGDRY